MFFSWYYFCLLYAEKWEYPIALLRISQDLVELSGERLARA